MVAVAGVDPSVIVAILAILATFVAGYFSVTAARAGIRNEKFLASNVGVSNGEGTVVEMLTKALSAQAVHEEKDVARFRAVFERLDIADPFGEVTSHGPPR